MTDQWKWWRDALAGKMPDSERGNPRAGFWKGPDHECIAIWYEAGQVYCERQRFGGGARMTPEQIDDLYGSCSRYPITEEVYRSIVEDGNDPPPGFCTRLTLKEIQAGMVWSLELGLKKLGPVAAPAPEEPAAAADEPAPAGMGHNNPPEPMTPEKELAAEISRHATGVKAWLAEIGGKPRNKAEADKVADYATVFGGLAKKAETARVTEKEPHLTACREIDGKWSPVKTNADSARKRCLDIAQAWMDEENARRREEARLAEEAAMKAAEAALRQSDEPIVPLPPAEPAPVTSVGNMRSVSTRTRKVWKVEDPRAYGAYLLALEQIPPDLLDALHKIAQRHGAAGVNAPGIVLDERKSAA